MTSQHESVPKPILTIECAHAGGPEGVRQIKTKSFPNNFNGLVFIYCDLRSIHHPFKSCANYLLKPEVFCSSTTYVHLCIISFYQKFLLMKVLSLSKWLWLKMKRSIGREFESRYGTLDAQFFTFVCWKSV